jgi:rhodanese-related sulfurtransferase
METTTGVKRITVDEVKEKIDRGEPILFIDTRNPVAWDDTQIKIQGAVRLHYGELEQHIDELPRDRTIVTYCT